MRKISSRRWLGVKSLLMLSGLILLVSGCARTAQDNAEHLSELSVDYGASIEEFKSAFSDIEPITLRYQSLSSGPQAQSGEVALQFAEDIYEWSDGKVEIEVHWNGSIASLDEIDSALMDGRLDLAEFPTTLMPQEYPISNNMIDASVRSSMSPLTGELAQQLAMVQATNDTEAVFEEYEANGLTPLVPVVAGSSLGLACKEKIDTIDDLSGWQVMSSSPVQSVQIEALGATVTSIDYTEMYEGFQRGILDCALAVPTVYSSTGLNEVAPYFYYPKDTTFQAGPSSILAGSSWASHPLVVRQLIHDKFYEWLQNSNNSIYRSIDATNQLMQGHGKQIEYLDSALSEALRDANINIAQEQAEATEYDAADFAQRYEEALILWREKAEELGYIDGGDYGDLGDWFEGNLDKADDDYLDEIYEIAYEHVFLNRRPS